MDRILGQNRAIETLQRALDSGRVHHAWIFHGPFGVGKFAAATELAKVLLDPEAGPDLSGRVSSDPDGPIARMVDQGAHPDLHIIRKELALHSSDPSVRARKLRNIPVDVLREYMIGGTLGDDRHFDSVAFQSARMGHAKVFIIDEAELMDAIGQNAVLKTLEEPPRRTYIILITTRVDELLPTIRSRCQQVAFVPLDEGAMSRWIGGNRPALDVSDDDERAWIVEFAAGSPGLAVMAARDGLYEWHRQLQPMLRRVDGGEFDASLGPALAGLVDEYATNWVKENREASKAAANTAGVQRVMLLLADHVSRRLRSALAAGADAEPWLDLIEMLEENERAVDRNVNLKLVFENVSAQWVDITACAAAAV